MDGGAIRERAKSIPTEPGVYRFLSTTGSDAGDGTGLDGAPTVDLVSVEEGDVEGLDAEMERVLYVGKAVDLRDRIRSYADPRSRRIRRMLQRADTVDVAVTDTETQALLLEANLIKRHRPRYNVRLKDDKSYPLVQLTDHEAPRIEITRDPDPGASVYGPFTNKGNLETVLKALRETFELRGCSDHKYASRSRPCLDYEMGLCSAPCTNEIDPADYRADVERVERFFNGETGVLAEPLRTAMEQAANEANFERAAHLRDRLAIVESFHEAGGAAVKSERETGRQVDVLGASLEGDTATVARLHAEDGQLLDRERRRLDAPAESTMQAEVLGAFIAQYYAERELPETILCPERPVHEGLADWLDGAGVELRVPGAGREATLVDLAMKNARTSARDTDAPAALAEALDVDSADRIEGFDVSHAGGSAVVGSNVVFVDGEPEKSDYRRKKLPEGNDDTDRMRRLVGWRADRALDGRDDRPDPDLLLIDGGVGQLNAALSAIDERGWDVPAVALAKDEEIVVTPDGERDWATDDERLHLLQRVRDEAHRFAVQYHETLRDEVRTVLEDVPGIGPTTRRRLLRRFGSVSAVRDASRDELQQVDGVGAETAATLAQRLG